MPATVLITGVCILFFSYSCVLAAQTAGAPFFSSSLWSWLWPLSLKVISIFSLVLLILSILLMILTFRRAKKVRPLALMISMLVSLTTMVIYSAFLQISLPLPVLLAAFGAGVLMGAGWSFTSRVFQEGQLVKTQGNIWHLVVWGGVFCLNQLIVILTGRPMQIAMVMLLASTGLMMGNGVSLLVRFYRLRAQTQGG